MTDLREVIARALYDHDWRDPEMPDWDQNPDAQEPYRDNASAALRAVADAGFVIVPREPTEVMVDEAAKEICRQQFIDPDGVTALAGGQHRNWSLRRPVARATLRAAISEGAK